MSRLIESLYGLSNSSLVTAIVQQLQLPVYLFSKRHTGTEIRPLSLDSNEEAWKNFWSEEVHDAREVRLNHFHLFEWFPLTPGRFHAPDAAGSRIAAREHFVEKDGHQFFNYLGKMTMIRAGIGAVRFSPRKINDELHYFMTASSTNVCHEGFPVLIPRRLYAEIKRRLLQEGAAPVNLTGEMRYLDASDIPATVPKMESAQFLYLHVNTLELLDEPRQGIVQFEVSSVVGFTAFFHGRKQACVSYATFDPSIPSSISDACSWLRDFYVNEQYGGEIVTDFDEVRPRFPDARFGLPKILKGAVTQSEVAEFLYENDPDEMKDLNRNQHQFSMYFQNFYSTQVGGDYINVGTIQNSSEIAIGTNATTQTER